MTQRSIRILVIVTALFFLAGCAAVQKPLMPFNPMDLNPKLKSGQYAQKANGFLVVLDSSGSMAGTFGGQKKVDIARNFVHRLNRTIPDMKIMGGLRTFGGVNNPFASHTSLIYGVLPYDRAKLDAALGTVLEGKGETPMSSAIKAGTHDLRAVGGNMAVIIVSDGRGTDGEPVPAAKQMKARYGDRVCIYTVLVGDDPVGAKNMTQIADAGGCGFMIQEGKTRSAADMADYVARVFLTKKALDSDGDGVIDELDKCPKTPRKEPVDKDGCPLDSDGDGVVDYMGACPKTPKGVKVNDVGCPPEKGPMDSDKDGVLDPSDKCPGTPIGAKVDAKGCWNLGIIYFDTDKSVIKQQYLPILGEVVYVMKQNPGLKMQIYGYTDSRASDNYNFKLSQRRAEAVKAYIAKMGIPAWRLLMVAEGKRKPAAPNTSPEGMAKNRRVELKPMR